MEKFRLWLNKQINLAHRSAHYFHLANLHKRLDLLIQNKILAFPKQYTPCPKHTVLENEFYDFRKKKGVFRLHVDAWENFEVAMLFLGKMASIPYNSFINTIS